MDMEEEVFNYVVLDTASRSDHHNCAYLSGLECFCAIEHRSASDS